MYRYFYRPGVTIYTEQSADVIQGADHEPIVYRLFLNNAESYYLVH